MSETEPIERRTEVVQRIWRTLHRSWLLGLVGGTLLLLYLFALFVQQMPGQLHDDPAGAQRWLLITSENYGPLGNVLRALGLFDVLHNPLLQLLLVLLALIVLINLGSAIAKAWRLYEMPNRLAIALMTVGDPLPVPTTAPTYRLRQAVGTDVAAVAALVQARLQQTFDSVTAHTITIQLPATTQTVERGEATAEAHAEQTSQATVAAQATNEHRLLALRNARYALFRPLFFLGLLLTLITVWLILLWGWSVSPAPLVPDADYRSAAHQLVLQYVVEPVSTMPAESSPGTASVADTSPIVTTTIPTTPMTIAPITEIVVNTATAMTVPHGGVPMLVAEIGGVSRRAAMGSTFRLNRGQTVIRSTAGPPALFLRTTSAEPLLSRLGQSQLVPTMGLLFPSPGSEESVVVDQALGLRIVRLPAQPTAQAEQFLAEVYDANNELQQRIPIRESSAIDLTIDNQIVTLEFVFLPGMQVEVAHQPAIWLFWPAAFLMLVGLVGYRYQPTFVLLQLAPWPVDRTVVVVQSDDPGEVPLIQEWLQADADERPKE